MLLASAVLRRTLLLQSTRSQICLCRHRRPVCSHFPVYVTNHVEPLRKSVPLLRLSSCVDEALSVGDHGAQIFRSEAFLDSHMDKHHANEYMPSAQTCLGDLCGVLHCDFFDAVAKGDAASLRHLACHIPTMENNKAICQVIERVNLDRANLFDFAECHCKAGNVSVAAGVAGGPEPTVGHVHAALYPDNRASRSHPFCAGPCA
jgi:hypothetical protein